MIFEIMLTIYLGIKPWERARPIMLSDRGITYVSLDKYKDISLKPELKPQPAMVASTKIVSPDKSKGEVNPGVNNLSRALPKTNSPEYLDPLFAKYAAQYNISEDILKRIAKCESNFRPWAVNGPYGGMFQFIISTWISNRNAMGEDPNPALRFNAEEAIKTTAFKIARDGTGAWPVCGR